MTSRYLLALLAILVATQSAYGDDPYVVEGTRQTQGHAQAWGNAVIEPVGDRHYKVTVNVWTRVKGRSRTARGGATYVGYDGHQKPVCHVGPVKKYCSTDPFHNDKQKHHAKSMQVKKAWFDANVIFEEVIILAQDKGGIPNNWNDVLDLVKKNIDPKKMWEEVKKLPVGGTVAIGNSVFRRRK